MPVQIHHVSIADFLRTDLTGVFDFEATKSLLTEIVESCFRSGVDRVLVDARSARPMNLGISDVYTLVMHLMSLGLGRGQKLAILNDPEDGFDRGKLFERCAVQQGMTVAAFRQFETALEWLNDDSL